MIASRDRSVLAALLAVLLAACAPETTRPITAGPCDPPTVISDYPVVKAIGNKWNAATQTLAYGLAREDGHFATYLSDLNGASSRRIAYGGWRDDRHQFPAAWHPSGRYLAMLVEKADHPGGSTPAIPGYGAYTDLWLVTRDGSKAWKLIDLPRDDDHALTHSAFSPDGSIFVWTERIKAPQFDLNHFVGSYRFNVATFVDDGSPRLTNIHHYIPGTGDQGGEVESIAADNKTIAFYSTYVSKNIFASRIYTMDTSSMAIRELTTGAWAQAPTFTPDGKHIVYTTGAQTDVFPWSLQGADWWIMDLDGGNKRRLSFMNVRDHPQSVNQFRLGGSTSFISDTSFLGDVMTHSFGLTGKIVRVDMKGECFSSPSAK